MLTLVMRQLEQKTMPSIPLETLTQQTQDLLSDLTQAHMVTIVTPVVSAPGGQEIARRIRWHTYATRDRLVLETTWHHDRQIVVFDAVRAAVDYHRFAGLWTVCQQASRAGYAWAGAWWSGVDDPLLDNLWFQDASEWASQKDGPIPPIGRKELPGGLVLEWLRPSVRIMKRLVNFAEECQIDWESLIIEDLMTDTPATYLELREGRSTLALARILQDTFLPGMEGYDPRSPRPPMEFDIESIEVHPDHRGKNYGSLLVREVQQMGRPIFTLDTYRRAEPFWIHMGFAHNRRRSSREDSNIFQWSPFLGEPVESRTDEGISTSSQK